jgi:hypothetical protein
MISTWNQRNLEQLKLNIEFQSLIGIQDDFNCGYLKPLLYAVIKVLLRGTALNIPFQLLDRTRVSPSNQPKAFNINISRSCAELSISSKRATPYSKRN